MHTVKVSHEIRNRALFFVFCLQLHDHDPRIEALAAEANRRVAELMCRGFFDGLEIKYEMKIGRVQQFILRAAPDEVVTSHFAVVIERVINMMKLAV